MYTHTQANRLITVTASGLTWSAAYNGDGARLKQVANGTPTTYTLDLAAPLVTALTERTGATTNQYLYGMGDSPLAVYSGTTWTYLSGRDGLNSVRQETDASGSVITERRFDPYGVPLNGNGGAPFGYTGEMYDASTQLVFLRARYYAPQQGRFVTQDALPGDWQRPQTLNSWSYVESNPINQEDPSGYGSAEYAACVSLVLSSNPAVSAGQLVRICREGFNQVGWNCQNRRQNWSWPQTVSDLMTDYICELGLDHIAFPGTDPLTRELAYSRIVHDIRVRFYLTGDIWGKELDFGAWQVWLATNYDPMFSIPMRRDIPITHFLGGFQYSVHQLPPDRVAFMIEDQKDRASGTHFPGRFPPAFQGSLEDLINRPQYQYLANVPVGLVLLNHKVISVLKELDRRQTVPPYGGGNFKQTFVWTERKLCLSAIVFSWPYYLPFLDIR